MNSLIALRDAAIEDRAMCQTKSERLCCDAVNDREILDTAATITEQRQLTQTELSIVASAQRGSRT